MQGISGFYAAVYQNFENFREKLFSFFAFDFILSNKDVLQNNILRLLESEKKEKIINDQEFGLNNKVGIYKWTKAMFAEDYQTASSELKEKFDLTDENIEAIIGPQSYLSTVRVYFNHVVAYNNQCSDPNSCSDEELVVNQIISGSLTKFVGVDNYKILTDALDENEYKYNASPEIYNTCSKNFTLSFDKFNDFFSKTNEKGISLLDPQNLVELYFYSENNDLYQAYKKFNIESMEQMHCLTKWITNDLRTYFYLLSFSEVRKGEGKDKAFSHVVGRAIDNSIKVLKENLGVVLYSRLVYELLKKEFSDCRSIMAKWSQGVAEKVCSNEKSDFQSYESTKFWGKGVLCNYSDDCKEKEIDEIVKVTELTKEEVYVILGKFNEYVKQALELVKAKYLCGDDCSNDKLVWYQWTMSRITKAPPIDEIEKSSSISAWDNQLFKYPPEFSAYYTFETEKYDDANIMFLHNEPEMNLNKLNFQKLSILVRNNIKEHKLYKQLNLENHQSTYEALKYLVQNFVFENIFTENNINDIIIGNTADSSFDILRTGGEYYDNFKPYAQKTKGLNLNLDDIETIDNIVMKTGGDEEPNTRKIVSINNSKILNTESDLYDLNTKESINKKIPLFSKKIENISDGFQYSFIEDKLYEYDPVSSRVLEYEYTTKKAFNGIDCFYYSLTLNLNQEFNSTYNDNVFFGEVFQKTSKPYVITNPNVLTDKDFNKNYQQIIDSTKNSTFSFDHHNNNYVCIDKFSGYVISYNRTLLYSIPSDHLDIVVPSLPEKTLIPVFTETRAATINKESFDKHFPGVIEYENVSFIIRIVGIIIALAFVILCFVFCVKFDNLNKKEKSTTVKDILLV